MNDKNVEKGRENMTGKKAIEGALQRVEAQSRLGDSEKESLAKDTGNKEESLSYGLLLHWGNWSKGWNNGPGFLPEAR